MQVEELNDLADWVKTNVLNFHESDEDTDDVSAADALHHDDDADAATNDVADEAHARRAEELSLLEFIIGIDNI